MMKTVPVDKSSWIQISSSHQQRSLLQRAMYCTH